jgi:hypothetical protein
MRLAHLAHLAHLTALLALATATDLSAQTDARADRGVYLTLFRSPATGVELRSGHAAAHLGFYPTVLSRDGARDNVSFVRAGATYYLRAHGASPYVSPSLLWSLDREWRSGALTEVGFRGRLYGRINGRLGAGVLTTLDGRVRVNPTIGLDLKLGARR